MTTDVWLEIGDASDTVPGEELRISWRWQVRSQSGSAELALVSPLTQNTQTLISSYVREFRSWRPGDRDRGLTAERSMLNLGRALGNALVDSRYAFLNFCERVEPAELHVSVVSSDRRVSELPWELLILPDSPYVISAACAAFVRADPGAQPFQAEARRLDLHAEQPLGYLRLASWQALGPTRSAVTTTWNQLRWQGALRYRLALGATSADLDVGARGDGSWQIIQWAGLVTRIAGVAHVLLEREGAPAQPMSASDFAARARALGAELLILEPSTHADHGATDELARAALQAGIDNVLVMCEPIEAGWPSDWIAQLLETLRTGLSLQRAVVETRKHLQRTLLEARQAELEQPHAPQVWQALRHYSRADVVFFNTPQQLEPLESTQAYAPLRGSLFGLAPDQLASKSPNLGDGAALALVAALQAHGSVLVHAAHGGGVTHALQRAGLLLRANADISCAYYWDFAHEAFSLTDLLQMVATAREQPDPEHASADSVLQGLAGQRELFVLDNLDALLTQSVDTPTAGLREIVNFVVRLAANGAWCALGVHSAAAVETVCELQPSALGKLELPPLSENDAIALLHATSPSALGLGPALFSMLEQLQGNPWLIQKVLGHCTLDNVAGVLEEARQAYGKAHGSEAQSPVELFQARRWQQLEAPWQSLLSVCASLGGLYLQTLMIAVDRPGGEFSENGRKLWQALGAPASVSCSAAIARLQAAGFLIGGAGGSRVDPAALSFLRAHWPPQLEHLEQAQLLLAKLVCEGVLRVLDQRNSALHNQITGHLLANHTVVEKQIETSLRSGEYGLATRAFTGVHALLLRAHLSHEAGAWARALLEAADPDMCTQQDLSAATAWLSIALRALAQPQAALGGAIELGVRHWDAQLAAGALTGADPTKRAIMPLVVAFLEQAYDQLGDYVRYRDVARTACTHYRSTSNYAALMPQLKALAAVEHTLGDSAERDRIEHELLHGIAYAELTDGAQLRQQTLAAVGGMRLRRADDQGCEALIALLDSDTAAPLAGWLALSMRGELAAFRGQWELACEYACRLWKAAMAGVRGIDVASVGQQLFQLRERVGVERFSELYECHAGSTPSPEAMGFMPRSS